MPTQGRIGKKAHSRFGRLDPKSGDDFVDFTFREFIYILEHIVKRRVRLKSNLKDPDNGSPLEGYLSNFDIIYLEAKSSKNKMVKTLIHELAHAMYYRQKHPNYSMHERKIRRVEEILWRRFTGDQKKILAKYLPKKEAKLAPPSSE